MLSNRISTIHILATPCLSKAAATPIATRHHFPFLERLFKVAPKVAAAAFGLLILLVSVRAEAVPVQGFVLSNGEQHYYDLILGVTTWTDAKADAETRSYLGVFGHLATIESAAENSVVNTVRLTCPSGCLYGGSIWIGYSDAASEGTWVWVTGEPTTYTNWDPGEPNNLGGIEDYAHIGAGGRWNDIRNSQSLSGYIIEYDTTGTTPLPAALPLFASGFGGLGVLGWRRKRKKAARAAA
jgi:hypothetical protein